MKNDFSQQFRPVLESAYAEACRFQSPVIGSEHFVLGAMRDKNGFTHRILTQLNVDIDKMVGELEQYLSQTQPSGETTTLFEQQYKITLAAIRHLQLATSEARKLHAHTISGEHILLALMHDQRHMDSEILKHIKEEYLNFDISFQNISDMPADMAKNFEDEDDDEDESFASRETPRQKSTSGRSGDKGAGGDTPALNKFGYDMTKAAAEGRLDPVVGRENEIERLAQILSRRKKNNPVLIGEPGVGKSAIVEGLALRIVQKKVSRILFDKRVIGLDMAGMVAGTKYRGQFEERIKAVVDELSKHPEIILFIDEIHTTVGAGGAPGSMDAANMHLASLAPTRVVSIWGATHPFCGFMGWRQNMEDAVQVQIGCRPCSVFGNKPCRRGDYLRLKAISPARILKT
ncbi:MAG: AAA family ATPase, partial [Muribaculaceae bacterium]|nr:AAA family ATPase [Muribaculaceae bacterium]